MIQFKTTPHADARTHYLNEYQRVEKHLIDSVEKHLLARRQTAIQQFSELGFPTLKHPDWKHTSLLPLLQIPFSITSTSPNINTELAARIEPSSGAHRLVFINGLFSPSLSQITTLANHLIISHLAHIIQNNPDHLFQHWKTTTGYENNSFIHLNTAFIQDGAYIYLPADSQLESPIELLFISTEENSFIPIRNIIIAEKNSRAVIIEKYIALKATEIAYFTHVVTECFLAEQSHIEHYKLLEESEHSTHIGNILVEQQTKSEFSAYSIALQGALLRSDVTVKLCQPHAQCHLKGLYYAQEKQHIAQQTLIEHASPQTVSSEFYKGIIDSNACAVFDGKLIVREKAIKSTAKQLNKNLLLSTAAEVYTKPQLEIFVDDIQCTHGASIGQLDETALFYLRARGLSEAEARATLIKAFIRDIIQQMPLLSTYSFLSQPLKNLAAINYETV